MKKILIVVVLSLLMVSVMAVPALAAAQKVALMPFAGQEDPSGSGFVVWNNSSGGVDGGAELTVSLKGAVPAADYEVFKGIPVWPWYLPIGTMTTNRQGNANFHMVIKDMPAGTYHVRIALNREGFTRFLTDFVAITIK